MGIKDYYKDSGLWALVLGGSSGIGLAAVQKFASQGLHVLVVHRDTRAVLPEVEAAFELCRTYGVRLESMNMNALGDDAIPSVITRLQECGAAGRLRVLLHSIAWGNVKKLADVPGKQLTITDMALTLRAMGTNLWEWAVALFENNVFAPGASVLGLTSEGSSRSWPYYGAVGAAKAALESVCRSLAQELAPHHIRTNLVCAGITETPALKFIPGHELLVESAMQRNPFGRLTTPGDVANAIFLLTTEEAGWINGTIIKADGGESAC